jgi:hypothetical protein
MNLTTSIAVGVVISTALGTAMQNIGVASASASRCRSRPARIGGGEFGATITEPTTPD